MINTVIQHAFYNNNKSRYGENEKFKLKNIPHHLGSRNIYSIPSVKRTFYNSRKL